MCNKQRRNVIKWRKRESERERPRLHFIVFCSCTCFHISPIPQKYCYRRKLPFFPGVPDNRIRYCSAQSIRNNCLRTLYFSLGWPALFQQPNKYIRINHLLRILRYPRKFFRQPLRRHARGNIRLFRIFHIFKQARRHSG